MPDEFKSLEKKSERDLGVLSLAHVTTVAPFPFLDLPSRSQVPPMPPSVNPTRRVSCNPDRPLQTLAGGRTRRRRDGKASTVRLSRSHECDEILRRVCCRRACLWRRGWPHERYIGHATSRTRITCPNSFAKHLKRFKQQVLIRIWLCNSLRRRSTSFHAIRVFLDHFNNIIRSCRLKNKLGRTFRWKKLSQMMLKSRIGTKI